MNKLTQKDNGDLISAIMFSYNIICGDPSTMCEEGRECYVHYDILLMNQIKPLLDENFQIEIENEGIFDFRYKSNRYGDDRVYNYCDLNSLTKL